MAQDAAALQARFIEVKQEIAQRTTEDSDFREALLKDANGTIEEEYSLEKGALGQFDMQVVVEEGNKLVITIPGDTSEMELSDDELDQVAGGFAFTVALTVGVIAGAATVTAAAIGGATATGAIVQATRAGRQW